MVVESHTGNIKYIPSEREALKVGEWRLIDPERVILTNLYGEFELTAETVHRVADPG